MPRRVIDLTTEEPILNIAGYGRAAPPLTPRQVKQISLTVRRVPEVMVKVSGGARTLHGVEQHLAYIGRAGELELEMDTGQVAVGKGAERALVEGSLRMFKSAGTGKLWSPVPVSFLQSRAPTRCAGPERRWSKDGGM
jgi:hypothetical protein